LRNARRLISRARHSPRATFLNSVA
jgi:hypothetical protein